MLEVQASPHKVMFEEESLSRAYDTRVTCRFAEGRAQGADRHIQVIPIGDTRLLRRSDRPSLATVDTSDLCGTVNKRWLLERDTQLRSTFAKIFGWASLRRVAD